MEASRDEEAEARSESLGFEKEVKFSLRLSQPLPSPSRLYMVMSSLLESATLAILYPQIACSQFLHSLSTFPEPPSLIYHNVIVAIVNGPAKLQ